MLHKRNRTLDGDAFAPKAVSVAPSIGYNKSGYRSWFSLHRRVVRLLESYLFPISYAFLAFPIAAALFTLPFLIVQYRRHGYINKYRGLLLYLFLLYLMNALFLVLLPMPSTVHNEPPEASSYVQWIPFHFIGDIVRETSVKLENPATYLHLLTERAFLQVVFNVVLTVPFGLFLRYYFRARFVTCVVASFGLSLLFEITQVTGIFGIFDYPYRLFDVDDLMTNTLGGMVGFVFAIWLSSHLPRMDKLDEGVDLATKRVSYTRRAVAFFLDWCLLVPVIGFLVWIDCPFPYVVAVIGYFIVVPFVTNGRTLGKWTVRIRLKGQGERIALRELMIRYGLLYVVAGGMQAHGWHSLLLKLFMMVIVLYYIAFAVNLLRCVVKRSLRPFYERKSCTGHVIS
jgi:glycopeptide antibiotics resistance protein